MKAVVAGHGASIAGNVRTLPLLYLFTAVTALSSSAALAQAPSPVDQILQRNEQERILEERRRELQRLRPSGTPLEQRTAPVAPVDGGACFNVRTVALEGNHVLAPSDLAPATALYENRCLSMEDLNELLRAITSVYIEHGYVTARAYVPEQDINSGTLHLQIVEGTVEGITLNGNETGWDRWRLITAFPGVEGSIPNLRDVEQGLDQMNRAASVRTTMELVPGQTAGGTIIAVKQERTKPWQGNFGVDNSGDKSTGTWRLSTGLGIDNPIGINDVWNLSASHTFPGYEGKHARSFSGGVSVPYGFWTFSLSGSLFYYRSTNQTPSQTFKTNGYSRTASFSVDRVLARDDSSKTIARAGLTRKWSASYIEDVRLISGDRDLSVLSVGVDHSRRMAGGLLSVGAGYERGLTIFGAMRDQSSASEVPKAQFDKYTLDVNYYLPFALYDQQLALSTTVRGQASPDTLYSSERIGIASSGAVRGFTDGSLMGDTGLFVRNELRWTPPLGDGEATMILGTPTPYIGLDRGWLKGDKLDPYERGNVTGLALGVRSSGRNFAFDVSWGRVLAAPSFMEKESSFYATVTVRF